MKTSNTISRFSLLLGTILLMSGCMTVPIPTSKFTDDSRTNMKSREVRKRLQNGVTTREQVFLTFGEPDQMNRAGTDIRYAWSKTYAQFFTLYHGGGGTRNDFGRDFTLKLKFTPDGLLKHHEIARSILDHQTQEEW